MGRSGFLFITQVCICVALAASAALYVHYLSPLDSGYCGPSSGCEAARRSGLGYFFGSSFVSLERMRSQAAPMIRSPFGCSLVDGQPVLGGCCGTVTY